MDEPAIEQPLFRVEGIPAPDRHEFAVVHPVGDVWSARLAVEYRQLRGEAQAEPDPSFFAGLDFDVDAVRRRLMQAVMPRRRGGNFDVVRSDLGELLLAHLCAAMYGVECGYRSIRDRELSDIPGRGIDLIGVEVPDPGAADWLVTLVLGEAKVSSEAASPPRVVDTAEDSLRNQHLGHLKYPAATARKVFDAGRRCKHASTRNLMMLAAALLEDGIWRQLRLVAASLLVRPSSCATNADFGSFFQSRTTSPQPMCGS